MRRAVAEKVSPIRSSDGFPQMASNSAGLNQAKPSGARSVTTSVRLIRYITGPRVVVVKREDRKRSSARPQRGRIRRGCGGAVSTAGGTSSRRGRKGGRGGSGGPGVGGANGGGSLMPLPGVPAGSEILQVLPGLEADGLAGGDGHLDPGLGIAAHAFLAVPYLEYAEAAELDALAFAQRVL